jgi:hypothetical protein
VGNQALSATSGIGEFMAGAVALVGLHGFEAIDQHGDQIALQGMFTQGFPPATSRIFSLVSVVW